MRTEPHTRPKASKNKTCQPVAVAGTRRRRPRGATRARPWRCATGHQGMDHVRANCQEVGTGGVQWRWARRATANAAQCRADEHQQDQQSWWQPTTRNRRRRRRPEDGRGSSARGPTEGKSPT